MPTHIALLRGINVLGRNKLPMKELAAILEQDGCASVRTYIQSGNVVFTHRSRSAERLASRISGAIDARKGFAPAVLVLTLADLERAIARNPYPEADASPTSVHVFFLAQTPPRPDTTTMDAIRTRTERYTLDGRCFYLHTPDGFGISKLAARAERLLGVHATARNWRTVTTLRDLAR